MAPDQLQAHWMRLSRAYRHLETMGDVIEDFTDENRDRVTDDLLFHDSLVITHLSETRASQQEMAATHLPRK